MTIHENVGTAKSVDTELAMIPIDSIDYQLLLNTYLNAVSLWWRLYVGRAVLTCT